MGALAAVGEQAICFRAEQNSRIGIGRIVKRQCAADVDSLQFGDGDNRQHSARTAPAALYTDPELSHGQRKTRETQELGKVAPRNIGILGRIDGEIAPPCRLAFHFAPVRGNRVKFRIKFERHTYVPWLPCKLASIGSSSRDSPGAVEPSSVITDRTSIYSGCESRGTIM